MSRRDKAARLRAAKKEYDAALAASFARPRAPIGCALAVRAETIRADVAAHGYTAPAPAVVVARGEQSAAPVRRGANPSAQRRADADLRLAPTGAMVAALPARPEVPTREPVSRALAPSAVDTAHAFMRLRAERTAREPAPAAAAAGLSIDGASVRRSDDHAAARGPLTLSERARQDGRGRAATIRREHATDAAVRAGAAPEPLDGSPRDPRWRSRG